jgi:hypothetical protein
MKFKDSYSGKALQREDGSFYAGMTDPKPHPRKPKEIIPGEVKWTHKPQDAVLLTKHVTTTLQRVVAHETRIGALVQPQPIRVVMMAYTVEAEVTELGNVPPTEPVQDLP